MGDDEVRESVEVAAELFESPPTEDTLGRMGREAALGAAAIEIAGPGFPYVELPRIAPLPGVNLGHVVAFDYGLFARVVWGLALELRDDLTAWRTRRDKLNMLAHCLGGLAFVVIGALGLALHFHVFGALVALFIGGAVQQSIAVKPDELDKRARGRRRECVQQLLAGKVPATTNDAQLARETPIAWGNARLHDHQVPVLVTKPADPFPGFGMILTTTTFVVPPRTDAARRMTDDTLREVVARELSRAARDAGFHEVVIGQVLVIDDASLQNGSPWMGSDGSPRLWADRASAAEGPVGDDPGSVRRFLAIQILFPRYQTVATVFARTFCVGRSAAVEFTLCSLGPLGRGHRELQERMRGLLEPPSPETQAQASTEQSTFASSLSWRLRLALLRRKRSTETLSTFADREPFADPFDAEEREALEKASQELGEQSYWLGDWARLGNWREQHSLVLAEDHFGSVESRAAMRALYERIATAALDALDHQGYDVASYRDAQGRVIVQLDKIDRVENLIIGDRVNVKQGEAPAPKPSGASPAA